MTSPQPDRLPTARLIAYSAPSLVTSIAALPMALFVPAFYSGDLGVPLAAVGGAIAFSRLLDVVTDPLIGLLSDRLPLPLGRRKTWMALGVPLFLVAIWQIFVPGDSASATHLLVWSAALYLGFTMIDLPQKAWGAELSTEYDERSRITSWREAISTVGQVALLAVLVWMASRGIENAALQLHGIALAVLVALPVLMLCCLVLVAERPPERVGPAPQSVLAENLATLAVVPVWLRLSSRFGKPQALLFAALWLAIWSIPMAFLREGQALLLIGLVVIRGSSFAAILFLSNSIAADVIDVDTLESGEQRSGLFFAVWGMLIKLALAFGVVLGTALPSLAGYDPSAEIVPPAIQGRLMAIYGGVPALLMFVGALFLRDFPITRARHAEVRARIEARLSGGAESVIATPGHEATQ